MCGPSTLLEKCKLKMRTYGKLGTTFLTKKLYTHV